MGLRSKAHSLVGGFPGFDGGEGDGVGSEGFLQLFIYYRGDVFRGGVDFIEGLNVIQAGMVVAL